MEAEDEKYIHRQNAEEAEMLEAKGKTREERMREMTGHAYGAQHLTLIVRFKVGRSYHSPERKMKMTRVAGGVAMSIADKF